MDLNIGPPTRFSQQGQVDWVALGNSTVSATVAVFARLATARVDPQTVAIGHALAGGFRLSDHGKLMSQPQ